MVSVAGIWPCTDVGSAARLDLVGHAGHTPPLAALNAGFPSPGRGSVSPVSQPSVPSLSAAYAAVKPLIEAASERVPATDAIRVAEYVLSWAFMADANGREPTAEEHQAVLGCSRATYYRRRATFRQAFPDADTPLAVEGSRALAETPVAAPGAALRTA
jgi:hypothetical protein